MSSIRVPRRAALLGAAAGLAGAGGHRLAVGQGTAPAPIASEAARPRAD